MPHLGEVEPLLLQQPLERLLVDPQRVLVKGAAGACGQQRLVVLLVHPQHPAHFDLPHGQLVQHVEDDLDAALHLALLDVGHCGEVAAQRAFVERQQGRIQRLAGLRAHLLPQELLGVAAVALEAHADHGLALLHGPGGAGEQEEQGCNREYGPHGRGGL